SYALSWKPCQGDSLNLPDHRSIKGDYEDLSEDAKYEHVDRNTQIRKVDKRQDDQD
ncbi:hypothetical protein Tco_0888404, partial [Tanacetum coccineum]